MPSASTCSVNSIKTGRSWVRLSRTCDPGKPHWFYSACRTERKRRQRKGQISRRLVLLIRRNSPPTLFSLSLKCLQLPADVLNIDYFAQSNSILISVYLTYLQRVKCLLISSQNTESPISILRCAVTRESGGAASLSPRQGGQRGWRRETHKGHYGALKRGEWCKVQGFGSGRGLNPERIVLTFILLRMCKHAMFPTMALILLPQLVGCIDSA